MKLTKSILAAEKIRKKISSEVEEFWVMALDPPKNMLALEMVARGTVDRCPVHLRDIFRFALRWNASSLLVAHNHPSGELWPSLEDIQFTKNLLRASRVLGIPVLDHLIITKSHHFSFADHWSSSAERESQVGSE